MLAIDLNTGSGFVYGRSSAAPPVGESIDALVNAALQAERESIPARDYLGASRIGEPCARRLCYELMQVPVDNGADFSGRMLRVFEAGHRFEEMTIRWLRLAGFDLRTHNRNGEQFGFSVANGRFRGHIDGVIVDGPKIGVEYPALLEHKAIRSSSWHDWSSAASKRRSRSIWRRCRSTWPISRSSVRCSSPSTRTRSRSATSSCCFRPPAAQALSDKAVNILRAVEAGELLPRIAASSDFYLCRSCPYARRCWESEP